MNGYEFTLSGEAISWNSMKQNIITRSTMEAKLVVSDVDDKEAE